MGKAEKYNICTDVGYVGHALSAAIKVKVNVWTFADVELSRDLKSARSSHVQLIIKGH